MLSPSNDKIEDFVYASISPYLYEGHDSTDISDIVEATRNFITAYLTELERDSLFKLDHKSRG